MKLKIKNEIYALVDPERYGFLNQYNWSMGGYKLRYPCAWIHGKERVLFMHQLVLGEPPPGLQVHHKDSNPLNNQKSNLTFVTPVENSTASGPRKGRRFKGVQLRKGRWIAAIAKTVNGKFCQYHIGTYDTEEEAAKQYNRVAREIHGEMAFQNMV